MAGRLEGKVALITGAARGTGEAIARCFAAEGARVMLADVKDDRGEGVAKGIGAMARYRHLDVTSERDWQVAIEDLQVRDGRLDVLVNNAAVLHMTLIDNTSRDTFETVMRVNVTGPFLGTRTCLPLMRASGGGSIVNIGSIDSVEGEPLTVAYTTSKFALRGLTKVTALENAKYGIRANCLCPSAGNSEMRTDLVGELNAAPPRPEGYKPRAPLGRKGMPEDVAPAALFFASDDSRWCTGTELVLDGGITAGHYYDQPGLFSTTL